MSKKGPRVTPTNCMKPIAACRGTNAIDAGAAHDPMQLVLINIT
jgi:hypothetical protein